MAFKIPETVPVCEPLKGHDDYASCSKVDITLDDVKKLVSIYEAICPVGSFSVGLDLHLKDSSLRLTIFFHPTLAKTAKEHGIDIWFICSLEKVNNVLNK